MFIHNFIYYLSYTLLVIPVLLIYYLFRNKNYKKKKLLIIAIAGILLNLLLIYSRFVEPNIIRVQETSIETGLQAKIVLISYLHIGTYKGETFLKNIVEKVNEINDIDFVVIAGDITYYPKKKLTDLLYPLNNIKYPTYAVLGNHDSEFTGPPIKKELEETLEKYRIKLIDNDTAIIPSTNITLLGLGDLWADDIDTSILPKSKNDNLIIVAHNPDTVYEYGEDIANLTLSGHTHGGQVRIPLIYKFFIPSSYSFDQGLYQTTAGKVFVSSGLGLTGLPFRLGIPPTIDVLSLK